MTTLRTADGQTVREPRSRASRLLLEAFAVVWLTVSVVLLSACAASDDSAESAADATFTASDEALEEQSLAGASSSAFDEETADEGEAPQAEAVGSGVDVNRAPSQAGRLIRRDASVTLEVENLADAIQDVNRVVITGDSYLAGEETDERFSRLTYKVPAESFDAALDALPAVGKLRSQQVSSDDRTDTIVDLRSQLETAEVSLERTRGFFEQAETVAELTAVEAELAQRETVVASLKAQLQNEERSVALSTINVTLMLTADSEVQLEEEPGTGLGDALGNGFSALTSVAFALLLVLAFLLPWLFPIIVVGLLLLWALRRFRNSLPDASNSRFVKPADVARSGKESSDTAGESVE